MIQPSPIPSPSAPELPWRGREVPHAVLDILRGCNISCPDCYNAHPPATKSMDRIRREFGQLLTLRNLQTVTISGGEPLLHPGLPEIVRMIRARGMRAAVLSNGLLLDSRAAATLRAAGADMVMLHIQANQRREDIPRGAPPDRWRELRSAKAALVAGAGMTAGLVHVASRTAMDECGTVVEEMIESPLFEFMLITAHTRFESLGPLRGDLVAGIRTVSSPRPAARLGPTSAEIHDTLARRGMRPFAQVPSSSNPAHPRWLTYLSATLRHGGTIRRLTITQGASDRFFIRLSRRIARRRTFFYRAGPARLRFQLLCNALSGAGNPASTLRFLAASCLPRARLVEKHIVFQEGPECLPDGTLDTCQDCPDATIRNGRLVPLCLADRLEDAP